MGVVYGGKGAENKDNLRSIRDIERVVRHYGLAHEGFDLNGRLERKRLEKADALLVVDSNCRSAVVRRGFFSAVGRLFGEDCVGQSPEAFAAARDKRETNGRLAETGLAVPENLFVKAETLDSREIRLRLADFLRRHGECAVVKDNFGSSSENVVLATGVPAVRQAVADVVAKCGQALVEQFVAGTELTVPCVTLGGEKLVLMPVEIEYPGPIYDFRVKHGFRLERSYSPPRLADAAVAVARESARIADRAVGCRSYCRVDMRIQEGRAVMIEVNGEPVLAKNDFLAEGAAACGLSYNRVIVGLLANSPAFAAYARRRGGALGRCVASTVERARSLSGSGSEPTTDVLGLVSALAAKTVGGDFSGAAYRQQGASARRPA